MEITLVFAHQLFAAHPAVTRTRPVAVLEDPLFFKDHEWPIDFHAQKLLFQRQTSDAWIAEHRAKGLEVSLLSPWPACPGIAGVPDPIGHVMANANAVHVCELADDVLTRRVESAGAHQDCKIIWYSSPGFLLNHEDVTRELASQKRFFMAKFYEGQRRHLNILMDDNAPVGGKWSYDLENRKKLPKDTIVPETKLIASKPDIQQLTWLSKNFPNAPGNVQTRWWPSTRAEALRVLEEFLNERFSRYGDYQDSISREHCFVFHSVISPFINAGLLTPDEVVTAALEKSARGGINLNAVEGFIRQIIGWREYIRGVYELAGRRQRTSNHFGFTNPMPAAIGLATTGIDPLDTVASRVDDNAWCHHIERLMVLGNFMLLTEIDPNEVYGYFMANFIDAWDWVMVPNVYGMSQYADGGMMCTKPYISGSNYLRKMSDFPKGEWCEVWDGLFWRFVDRQRETLASNPRAVMMVRNFDRMDADRRRGHLASANQFLDTLHG